MNAPDRPFRAAGFLLHSILVLLIATAIVGNAAPSEQPVSDPAKSPDKISYYRDVRPILQANCQGCHQPAKAKGGYEMTHFKGLLAGGETEGTAIVPEHADRSSILKMVTPQNGEARMPKGKSSLGETDVSVLSKWIEQGALDDTPPDAKRHYDTEHPPLYSPPTFGCVS